MAIDLTLSVADQILALDARLTLVEGIIPFPMGVSPPPPPPPPSTSTLVLYLSEDAYLGDAIFTVKVDGVQIGTGTVTTLHSTGKSQTFSYQGTWATGPHVVTVTFTNDSYGGTAAKDRNLYVDGMDFKGTHFGTTASLLGAGPVNFNVQ